MKKLYFSLLASIAAFGMYAQTITAVNHGPQNGNNYSVNQCDSMSVSVGGNGASINWNFNSLVTHSNITYNYTVAQGSYTGWPTASLSVASNTFNTDISYYSYNASNLLFWGGDLQFGAVPCELKFSNPAVFMTYPTALNQGTTSAIAGSVVALSNAGTFTGVCTSTALATGTMVLPAKTFSNVIRVTQNISISFTILGSPGTAVRNLYEFYSLSDSRYPILTINQSTIQSLAGTSNQNYVYVQKNYQNVGLNEASTAAPISMLVYPNPASEMVHFMSESSSARNLIIYDVTGKQIEKMNMSNGSYNLNTSSYNNGLYIYKITDESNRQLKTGRITVVH